MERHADKKQETERHPDRQIYRERERNIEREKRDIVRERERERDIVR